MVNPAETLVQSVRTLRRSPVFTILATLVLAAGVGANTGIFSLANWALLRPVPGVTGSENLVRVSAKDGGSASIVPLSNPVVSRLIEAGPAIEAGTAFRTQPLDVMTSSDGAASREVGQVVTPAFFDVLGVRMHIGRGFTPVEGAPETVHAVVVLSFRYWREVLHGPSDVLGRELTLNGRTFTVIGVAAEGFNGPDRTDRVAMWLPSSALPAVMGRLPANVLSMERAPLWGWLLVRKAPGATVGAIAAQLSRAEPTLASAGIEFDVDSRVGLPPSLRERLNATFLVVGSLVALLWLLTAANLANLLLSRASRRHHEVAVRRAIGASSAQVTATILAEGLLLAAVGTVVALAASVVTVRVLGGRSLALGFVQQGSVPLDLRVFGFATLTALTSAALASLAAATAARRSGAIAALRARSTTVSGRRFRAGLVAVQLGLSVALVVGAGLAARSLTLIQSRDLGFDPEHVLLFSLNPGVQGYPDAAADGLFRDLLRQIEADRGVESAGFAWLAPLGTQRYAEQVTGVGSTAEPIAAQANMVTPGMFDALGMELIEGRTFDEREYGRSDRPDHGAVILNRSLARTLFPGQTAVGREIHMEGRRESSFEVIGVVADARILSLREMPGPALYDPFGNGYSTSNATFAVRTAQHDPAIAARIRELVRQRDPRLPLLDPAPLDDVIAAELIEERLLTRVTSVFALLSLLLAAAGLFGLVSESVQARVREFGVRSALGASGSHLIRLVLRDVFVIVGAGAVLGLVLSTQVGELMRARLFGVEPGNPWAVGSAVLVLGIVALAATIGPASRAARIDPLDAIRAD